MKNILTLLAIVLLGVVGFNLHSQNNKYVVVPIQLDFLKGRDQYRVNTLIRYLFNQEGFETYFGTEEMPEDLFKDRCKAIYVDAKKIKGFLMTKIQLELKDCRGNLVSISEIGKSKEKDFKLAYHEAIKEAFKSLQLDSISQIVEDSETEIYDTALSVPNKAKVVASDGEVSVSANSPSKERYTELKGPTEELELESRTKSLSTLFAQPLENGEYQLVNMEPRIVMVVQKTDIKDTYKVKGENSILFKKNGHWVYAKTVDGKTTEQYFNIKF